MQEETQAEVGCRKWHRPLHTHYLSNSKTLKLASVSVSVTLMNSGEIQVGIGNDYLILNPPRLPDVLLVAREVGIGNPEINSQGLKSVTVTG